ncbi:hypothetical protein RIF29_18389 [Crotalaria pallida]|uniref:BHLH domain-containing protein n=1 Tax=Crotalaria pallida TaxID=3830 RepID=A0AAN9IDV3_CROPI
MEGSNTPMIDASGGSKWLSDSQVDEHINILPEESDLNFLDVDDHSQDQSISDSERERREELRQSFIALAALVPGLKQGSVLGDAIKYVKDLKERVSVLEEECKKPKLIIVDDDESSSSSCHESSEPILRVDARMSGQEVLLRIHCKRQEDIMVKILSQIQSLHLFVVKSSVLRFGDDSVAITIVAQVRKHSDPKQP